MTEQAWGTVRATRQPGSQRADRCTRHSSPSADLIIRVLRKTKESPLITLILEIYFSNLPGRFIKTIIDARRLFEYVTPHGLIGPGERGWFGSSNSSNPGQCVYERAGTILLLHKVATQWSMCAHGFAGMLLDKHGGKLWQEAMKYGYFPTS